MLPILIYLLLKQIGRQGQIEISVKKIRPILRSALKVMVCILLFLFISCISINALGQQLKYKVNYKGDPIGWMRLEKKCDSSQYCRLVLTSETRFRMILSFNSSIVETAFFLKDRMVFSSQYYKLNNDIKTNKKTKFNGKGYDVIEDNESQKLGINDVNFNLMCMYFQEPVSIKKVYCDKQECFSDIEKTDDGGYKVRFPNGDSNCYYYDNGICNRVKIKHTFYSAEVILDNQNK